MPPSVRAARIAPAVGTALRTSAASGCHSFERWIARAHWKKALSTATTTTHLGGLPSITKRASTSPCGRDVRAPVHAERFADARDQKQQGDTRVEHDVAQTVDAIVAAPLGQQERVRILYRHKGRRIATG